MEGLSDFVDSPKSEKPKAAPKIERPDKEEASLSLEKLGVCQVAQIGKQRILSPIKETKEDSCTPIGMSELKTSAIKEFVESDIDLDNIEELIQQESSSEVSDNVGALD